MGIVLKQSIKNTVTTYVGFGVAALNALVLYTNFLTDEYYGLITVILATSAVLMPILSFGIPNTIVKYYSTVRNTKDENSFLTLMLFLPLVFVLPLVVCVYFISNIVGYYLVQENPIVANYLWHIVFIGIAMAYFEVFYAWSKVQLKTVFGNFLKEVFHRLCITILLFFVYFKWITVDTFIHCLVLVFVLRLAIMKLYAFSLKWPKLSLNFPKRTKEIITYSLFIILGGSAAVLILELDKVMLNHFLAIENVAYYGVSIYIATVIAVPSRAMHHITYPLTANLLADRDMVGLLSLYQKSAITLLLGSGILFVLIITNLESIYQILPPAYGNGFLIVLCVGLARVYDGALGNINAILYNSKYFKMVLVFGIVLAMATVLFNLWLIPNFGVNGAAFASLLAIFLYNTAKLFFVWITFKMQPFTRATWISLVLLIVVGGLFYSIMLPFHPILAIIVKSSICMLCFLLATYYLNLSEDITNVLGQLLKRTKTKK